jgi:hypothetical protein
VSDEDDDKQEQEDAAELPAWRFIVQEIRKLLVPVLAALVAGGAAGSTVSHFQTEDTKKEAVEEAVEKAGEKAQEKAQEHTQEVERARAMIRKHLITKASWDDVSRTMTVDEDALVKKVYSDKLDKDAVRRLVKGEVRNMTDQRAWAAQGR